MRFFTSDTHFGHARINELSGRPFSSVDEMNEIIIARWNSVVRPDDMVFHLGDVSLGEIDKTLPLLSRLMGQKFLVPGNHDRIHPSNKPKMVERFAPEYRKYFTVLPLSLPLTLNNGLVVNVCHFPYRGDHGDVDRYPEFRPEDDGKVLLHGHVHELWKVKNRMLNVGVDVNDFAPVSEDDIIDRINYWC